MRLNFGKIPDEKNAHFFRGLRYTLESVDPGDAAFMITIAGYPGVGKGTLAENIAKYLEPNAVAVDLSHYLKSREERAALGISGYNPNGSHLDRVEKDLLDLKRRRPIIIKPSYDHKTGKRLEEQRVEPKPVVITSEGIAFYGNLARLFDLKIFLVVDPKAVDKNQYVRMKRNLDERGHSVTSASEIEMRNTQDYKIFVAPTMRLADAVYVVDEDFVLTPVRVGGAFKMPLPL